MKIRMKIPVTGTFHNIEGGVARGQVVELPDEEAQRYCSNGMAEPVVEIPEERAVAPQPEKRKRGRPRKSV